MPTVTHKGDTEDAELDHNHSISSSSRCRLTNALDFWISWIFLDFLMFKHWTSLQRLKNVAIVQWFKLIWDLDLFCENEGEDDVEVEEKANEREQGEDQA